MRSWLKSKTRLLARVSTLAVGFGASFIGVAFANEGSSNNVNDYFEKQNKPWIMLSGFGQKDGYSLEDLLRVEEDSKDKNGNRTIIFCKKMIKDKEGKPVFDENGKPVWKSPLINCAPFNGRVDGMEVPAEGIIGPDSEPMLKASEQDEKVIPVLLASAHNIVTAKFEADKNKEETVVAMVQQAVERPVTTVRRPTRAAPQVQMAAANNNKPQVVDLVKMMPAVPADMPVQIAEFGQDNPAVKRDNLNKMQMAFAEIADAQAADAAMAQQNIAAAKAEQEKADEFEQKFSLKGMIASLFNIPSFAKKSEQEQTAFAPEPEKPQPLPTDIPGNRVATVVAIAAAASSAAVPPRGNGNLSMKFKEVAEVTRTVAGKIESFHRITTYDDQVFDISQTKLTADRNLAYRIKVVDGKETYQFVDLNETVLAKLQQSMARKAKEAVAPKVA